jgi:hypothetical protein
MPCRHHLIAATLLTTIALSGCNKSARETTSSGDQNQSMIEPYTPPAMPPFPTDYDGVIKTLAPYYHQQRLLDYFFELYVVDVIEELPEATSQALDEFSAKHPTFFEKHNGDWRRLVVEESHLSDTIDIAIWDLWIRNSANAKRDGWEYHPWHFAQNFADNYLADDSRVDVWEGDALEQAKKRIKAYRNKNR